MSTNELMDPQVTKFLTEYQTRVEERRDEIVSKIGQGGFDELMAEARKRDSTRLAEWEAYHQAKDRALKEGGGTPEDSLRATKAALQVVSDPSVRDMVKEDVAKDVGAFDAFDHLRNKFGLLIGDPDKLARDFRNRLSTVAGPIGEVLAELTDYARFQGRFRNALNATPTLKGERPEDKAVRVAEDHTQLGTGLKIIAEDPTGRTQFLQELGVDPSAVRQFALNKVLRKFPEIQERVEKKREDFESFALAKELYLQMGANRESMAEKLVEEGQVQDIGEAQKIVTGWLREAHESLAQAKKSLPKVEVTTPNLEERSVETTDPFGMPPPPSESETGFRGFMQGAFRGVADLYGDLASKFGDTGLSGISGLAAPRPVPGDSFLKNVLSAQTFGELTGWTLGMLPSFSLARATGIPGRLRALRGGSVTGPAAEFGIAEALTPETDVGLGERAQRGAIATGLGGAAGLAGKGVVAAGKGIARAVRPKKQPKASPPKRPPPTPASVTRGERPPGKVATETFKGPSRIEGQERATAIRGLSKTGREKLKAKKSIEDAERDLEDIFAEGQVGGDVRSEFLSKGLERAQGRLISLERQEVDLIKRAGGVENLPSGLIVDRLNSIVKSHTTARSAREYVGIVRNAMLRKGSDKKGATDITITGGLGDEILSDPVLAAIPFKIKKVGDIERAFSFLKGRAKSISGTGGLEREFRKKAKEGRLPISEAKTLGGQIRKGPDNPNPTPRLKDDNETLSLAALNKSLSGKTDPPKLPDISTPPKGDFHRQIVRDLDAVNDTRKAAEFIHKGPIRKAQAETAKEAVKMREIESLIPRRKRAAAGETIAFAVEGTADPRIAGDTPAKVLQRLKGIRGGEEAASRLRDISEEGRRRLNGYAQKALHTEEERIKFISDYIAHFWVSPKGRTIEQAVRAWRKKQGFGGPGPAIRAGGPPSAKKRVIPTYAEGLEMGLTPKTLNAFDLHKMWADANWKAIAHQEVFRGLRKLKATDGSPVFLPGGLEFQTVKNFRDYETIRSGIFRNGVALVHKEIAPVVKMITERPMSGAFGKALDTYNAYNKVVNVGFSGFHTFALLESMWASMRKGFFLSKAFVRVGAVDPLTRRRTFIQFPLLRARKILKDEDAIDLMAEGGVSLSRFEPTTGFGRVHTHMQNLERWLDGKAAQSKGLGLFSRTPIELAKLPPKGVRKLIEINNVAMWDFVHNGAKAYTYMEHAMHYMNQLAKREAKGKPVISKLTGKPKTRAEILDEIGDFTNRAYGGIEWETQYWASPELQKQLRRAAFSLDWSTANVQIAAAPFSKGIKGELGRRYAINMALSLYGAQAGIQWFAHKVSNADELNKKISDPKQRHQPWMWDNGPGKLFNVDMTPWYHAKGAWSPGEPRIYIGLGKQAREPFRWIMEPHTSALNKSSPAINVMMDTIEEAHQSEYGWRLGGDNFFDILGRKAKERFRPFSFQPSQFLFTVPKKRGKSAFAVQKDMETALRIFAEPLSWSSVNPKNWGKLVKSRDPKVVGAYEQLVGDMIDVAKRNGHDPDKLLTQALRGARQHYSREFFEAWKNSPRDPKTGKVRLFEQKRMEDAAEKLALMDASLEYWKKKFESKGVKLTPVEEKEIDELVQRSFKAIGN